ncbi:methylated-DNA--[protein]-cysteine S-methyltransferase [Furfurilactobacillus siliginis]|uniref:methylated-DNA--[protein]-cysteine S-methyltransferase n=1 Tax=Furfurilactobacillus siliginis TaxID=348151 RepID=A0A0R2KX21_9LACO|nr:methylated-DNA--[protein]-cysteine S-methyltransferase [Furfurilactobacillus siliginis]KRN94095.1 ogt protein [Furfurilactobacillus siliginis]GEK29475.1 methylated-DNA--protein-cysteine methyltransferase, inducible [Furfurilactobacillus siliginis]
MTQLYYDTVPFEDGLLQLLASSKGIVFIGSPNESVSEANTYIDDPLAVANAIKDTSITEPYIKLLTQYLSGQTTDFDTIRIDNLTVGTQLQRDVWTALRMIPYGMTCDYSTIAQNIGKPTAIRAVASAVAKNPVLIVTPCHRVIRKDGGMGGYRGGLPMKKALLKLEQRD